MMPIRSQKPEARSHARSGYTYVELMVASALATVLLVLLLVLTMYGERSFALMTNYADLDSSSRNTLDLLSRELREATRVTQTQDNAGQKSLTLTNAIEATSLKLVWDSALRTLTMEKSSNAPKVLLTGCDSWDYTLYAGAPTLAAGNVSFAVASSLDQCKLIQMSWTCSRTILGKSQASSVESVRFGLRNNVQ